MVVVNAIKLWQVSHRALLLAVRTLWFAKFPYTSLALSGIFTRLAECCLRCQVSESATRQFGPRYSPVLGSLAVADVGI
jgi:hypothetical protein